MKVYLAAPYVRKDEIKARAEELREAGIEVTSSWLEEPHKPSIQMHELTHEEHQEYAMNDVRDVLAADLLVFFTDPTKAIIRAGRHVEFGMAVARYMPIVVVGCEFENIFHHLSNVTHYESWTEAKQMLVAYAKSLDAGR